MMKMGVLGTVGALANVLASVHGRSGWAPHPSMGRGAQGAPSLQAWGTPWCWHSMTTRQ